MSVARSPPRLRRPARNEPAPAIVVRYSPRTVAGVQALYFVTSGAWSLLDRRSFEAVTGEKHDYWLVRTVGGLAVATGISLGIAVLRGRKEPEKVVLASGLVFSIADLRAARTHSRLYLADTALQLAFAPAWLRSWGGREA